jgi:hypothetical protein
MKLIKSVLYLLQFQNHSSKTLPLYGIYKSTMQPFFLKMTVCEICDHAHFRTGNAEEAGSFEMLIINYKTTRPRVEVDSDFCF